MSLSARTIRVGARISPLSLVQVEEVFQELKAHHPDLVFEKVFLATSGDEDLQTSLKSLERSDFFTRQLDEGLLKGDFQIAIHSAKDLPTPLPEGLCVAAITQGIDPSDVIVLPDQIASLKEGAEIGTSSLNREKRVIAFRSDLLCKDIRGTIEKRLEMLDTGHYDGVVMAEAALIRLQLTHRKRIPLPGQAAPYQGRLAVVVRKEDQEMLELFSCIHKKTLLYLGTDPASFVSQNRILHFPVIEIIPKDRKEPSLKSAYEDLNLYTHLLFTSKNAVRVFFEHLEQISFPISHLIHKTVIAVGSVTAEHLRPYGFFSVHVAELEQQEGVIDLLNGWNLEGAYLFLPKSALSRPLLTHYLQKREIRYQACDLYDVRTNRGISPPDLNLIDEILFTSPSTVKGFLEIFGHLPENKKLTAIGPITQKALQTYKECSR